MIPQRQSLQVILFLFFLIISTSDIYSAPKLKKDKKTETRSAGAAYEAGGLHTFFFGAHYRNVWAVPVDVPILDLNDFAGGLTPIKKGGGLQTISLRFKAAAGGQFAFRSISKDPKKTLPPDLRETIAADVIQDQISSSHPYAALIVPILAEAVGVLHANPKLFIMPDDARLGEFRQEFAGLMGIIEERPVDGPKGMAGFAGSKKIIGTYDLFERLEKKYKEQVNQKAFLKARLLDIFLGDWDRHVDQWRWARFKKDGKKMWYPIPRDRDQALAKLDGLLPGIADKRYIVPQLEGFHKDEPDIFSLTFSGRHLDRIFLNALSKADFEKISTEFNNELTDEIIESAVLQLPKPVYDISGEEILKKLKERRGLMNNAAATYYDNLTQYVTIVAKGEADFAEIVHRDDNRTEIKVFQQDTTQSKKHLLYHRTFIKGETKEIRLYLKAGNDKAIVTGSDGIPIRIIGGPGHDEFIDESNSKTYFYDIRSTTKLTKGSRTSFKTGEVDSIVNEHEYEPQLRQSGSTFKPVPFLAINADDGLFLGGGAVIYNYGFRKEPYASKISFRGNHSFKTSAFRVGFTGDFVDAFFGMRFNIDMHASVPRHIRNFYGLGNNSPRNSDQEADDFYRVQTEEYQIKPTFHAHIFPQASAFWGVAAQRLKTDIDADDDRFIRDERDRTPGINVSDLLELTTGFKLDSRNNPVHTTKGILGNATLSHFPKVFDNDTSFTKALVDLRFYCTPVRDVTLAIRTKAEKIWGDFPYYQGVYLGGPGSLRAFRKERFGGDASALGSAELRFYLFRAKIIFPTDFGLFFFGDAGRVWLDDKSPGSWHTSNGGGLWLAPIFRNLTFSIAAANSTEGLRIIAGGGFGF